MLHIIRILLQQGLDAGMGVAGLFCRERQAKDPPNDDLLNVVG